MQVGIVAVGRLKAGPERELAGRYLGRAAALARGLGFAGPDVVETGESRARRTEDRQAEEADRIRERVGSAVLVALDERAAAMTSESFAGRLAALRDEGRPRLAFVIGGPDGLHPDLRRAAGWQLAFGALTLPHQIVRILLAEQIYRAFTIIAGHPYHRAGDGQA